MRFFISAVLMLAFSWAQAGVVETCNFQLEASGETFKGHIVIYEKGGELKGDAVVNGEFHIQAGAADKNQIKKTKENKSMFDEMAGFVGIDSKKLAMADAYKVDSNPGQEDGGGAQIIALLDKKGAVLARIGIIGWAYFACLP